MFYSRQRPRRRHRILGLNIQDKANRVLNIALVGMLLIFVRIWHLAVIQHEARVQEARKPTQRVVLEPSRRASIRDRFDIPLAINKIQYQATILYSQLQEIPSVDWEKTSSGKKIKKFKRKEYITKLAEKLGQELQLDPVRLEDLIYSKAAFYSHVPFIIKEDISEEEYYRLKMMEKDWPGIFARKSPQRFYPKGRLASDILGYMGAINRQEYESIIQEIKTLERYLHEEEVGEDAELPPNIDSPIMAQKRLKELEERAYSINDYVGKSGIEGKFEEQLRGFQGKKTYYSNAQGQFLHEMPGSRPPLPGERFRISISAELQEYAEQLLAQNEEIRRMGSLQQPWMRGGAIVAMDPNTGEVLAMASYPRFNPNDFINSGNSETLQDKHRHILRWLENDAYLEAIWNQKVPLEREVYQKNKKVFEDEAVMLTWETYLALILPDQHPVRKAFERLNTVQKAVEVQQSLSALLALSGQTDVRALLNILFRSDSHTPFRLNLTPSQKEAIEDQLHLHSGMVDPLKDKLNSALGNMELNYDKLLFVDLARVAVPGDLFSPDLLKVVGKQTLSAYRDASAAYTTIQEVVKGIAKELFHDTQFNMWRKEKSKVFLKEKRAKEKEEKKYPKPYIDYFDAIEQEMFEDFWKQYRWMFSTIFIKGELSQEMVSDEVKPYVNLFLTWHDELSLGGYQAIGWKNSYLTLQGALRGLSFDQAEAYLQTLRSFQDLQRPLLGKYRHLRRGNPLFTEQSLALAFYPKFGFGYGRSQAYRQAATQGSIFKVVTAYEALMQRFEIFKASGSRFDQLNPLEIIDRHQVQGNSGFVGMWMNGTQIPRVYKGGRLPKSLKNEIGRMDILKALETSSNPYFAILAGDFMENPDDLSNAAKLFSYGKRTGIDLPGEINGRVPEDLSFNRTGLYSMAIGQHSLVVTPLQTAVMLSALANGGQVLKPQIISETVEEELAGGKDEISEHIHSYAPLMKREVPLPNQIRNVILEGMRRVVGHIQDDGIKSLERIYQPCPEAIKTFIGMRNYLVGKSSSAESMEHLTLALHEGTQKCTHIWFGGIAFDHSIASHPVVTSSMDVFGKPELVVIVYLRHGSYGKGAAPVAAQMVERWREIKKKHEE